MLTCVHATEKRSTIWPQSFSSPRKTRPQCSSLYSSDRCVCEAHTERERERGKQERRERTVKEENKREERETSKKKLSAQQTAGPCDTRVTDCVMCVFNYLLAVREKQRQIEKPNPERRATFLCLCLCGRVRECTDVDVLFCVQCSELVAQGKYEEAQKNLNKYERARERERVRLSES